MFRIANKELDVLIHDLIRIASILKAVDNGQLTEGQKTIIHGCEIRLNEIREHLLQKVEEEEEKNHGKDS